MKVRKANERKEEREEEEEEEEVSVVSGLVLRRGKEMEMLGIFFFFLYEHNIHYM